jgi:hypothetical protein
MDQTVSTAARGCVAPVRAAMAVAAMAVAVLAGQAVAQDKTRPTVNVAPVILAEPGVETALPIQVGPADATPPKSFLRIRGLPAAASLSEGHGISAGAWAIPLSALPSLKITAPIAATGKSEIIVSLVGVDGTVMAESRSSLVVAPAALIAPGDPKPATQSSLASLGQQPVELPGAPRPAPAARPNVQPQAAPVPQLKSEERERAARLLRKGDEEMAEGSIASARLFYERAAEAGLAEGAMALAATYDPDELQRRNVRGMLPDPAAARKWYERAQALGAPEAGERLRRLGSR